MGLSSWLVYVQFVLCGYDVESNFRIIKGVGNGNSAVITVRWSSNVMPNLLYLYLISSTHFPCDSSIGSRFINQPLLQFITSSQDLDKLNVLTRCSALLISYRLFDCVMFFSF